VSGDVSSQKLIVEIGEGGNGKGVLNDFMSKHVFGTYPIGYSCEIPIEALLHTTGERHPTELMDLWHTRLALARESDEDTRWNEGRVKRLSGGDRIKARHMRQDFVEFDPTHHLIIFGNAKPAMSGGDQAAMRRRLEMIMFPQLWADEADQEKGILKADTRLHETLRAEAAGVLHKLIQACRVWYRERDLKPPATVRAASTSYLEAQSIVSTFLDDCCDRTNPWSTVTVGQLWTAFQRWCQAANEHPGKRNQFNDKLARAGIRIERTGQKRGICTGLTIKTSREDSENSELRND
jgi:putative DNA primase/helicase